MRILVTADIHLGSPIRSAALRNPELGERLQQASRDVFASIIDLAIEERVEALVLGGDIFDNDRVDLRLQAFLLLQLARLEEAGIHSIMIRGNHDAMADHKKLGNLGKKIHLLQKDNPTIHIEDVAFHGLSFVKAHTTRSFLPDYPPPEQGRRNVGIMHTSLGGAEGHDLYAPCSESDLLAHGYDLWCLGHIHAPFERGDHTVRAVMPGIPQPRHIGERHGGKVALVTLSDTGSNLEWRSVAKLVFVQSELDLSKADESASVMDTLTEHLRALQIDSQDVALRLIVIADHYASSTMTDLVEECLENIQGVYLDKLKMRSFALSEVDSSDELLSLMLEEYSSEAFALSSSQVVKELSDVLPAQIRSELDETQYEELLAEALQEVSARLRSS